MNSTLKRYICLAMIALVFISKMFAQSNTFDLNLHDVTLKDFFLEIEKQSEFSIFYKENVIDPKRISNSCISKYRYSSCFERSSKEISIDVSDT